MSETLVPNERRRRILESLFEHQSVRVTELSQLLGVSEVTIRRDLESMERDNLLERCHGGATLNTHLNIEPLFSQKNTSFLEEKRRIGMLAASLVEDGETIFINSGTTTLQIFRHLAGKNLQVITSNMGAITEGEVPGVEVIAIGGIYRAHSHSFVGAPALQSLKHYYASKCFIGVDGVSIRHGLTTPSIDEAMVASTMIERTHGKAIIVVDHSKFGVIASSLTSELDLADVVVTDSGVDPGYKQDLERMGVEVLIADMD